MIQEKRLFLDDNEEYIFVGFNFDGVKLKGIRFKQSINKDPIDHIWAPNQMLDWEMHLLDPDEYPIGMDYGHVDDDETKPVNRIKLYFWKPNSRQNITPPIA